MCFNLYNYVYKLRTKCENWKIENGKNLSTVRLNPKLLVLIKRVYNMT